MDRPQHVDPLTGGTVRSPESDLLYQATLAAGSPAAFALRPPERLGAEPMSIGDRLVELMSWLGGALPGRGGVGPLRPTRVRGGMVTPGAYGNVIRTRERLLGEPLTQVRQGSVLGSAPGQADHILDAPRRLAQARRTAETAAEFRPGRVRKIDTPAVQHVDALKAPPNTKLRPAERLIRELMHAWQLSSQQ